MKNCLFAGAFAAVLWGAASATPTTSVEYTYSANAEAGPNSTDANALPNDIVTINDQDPIEPGNPDNFASFIGFGENSPISFLGGAVVAGGSANSSSQLTATLTIVNNGPAAELFWQGLVFGGGVGFAIPDFSAQDCAFGDIAQCGTFQTPIVNGFLPGLDEGGASLATSAVVTNLSSGSTTTLFDETLNVDGDGVVSGSLLDDEGLILNNFGAAANNAAFINWDDTEILQSLGVVGSGESVTLEFMISSSVFLDGSNNCIPGSQVVLGDVGPFLAGCIAAFAGFGDPEEEGNEDGGWGLGSSITLFSQSFTISAITAEVVPVPAAVWLFGTVLAAGFGARRLKRKAA